MRKAASLALIAALALGPVYAAGCSSSTTKTTRTVERPVEGSTSEREVVTTTESESSGGGGGGVVSSTINAIGFVLALPFKIVGGIIEFIF